MTQVRILNEKEVNQIFNMEKAITAVEAAYLEKGKGQASLWPMVFHEFEAGKADLDIKSGDLQASDLHGLKIVSWFGDNSSKNLPALLSTALIFDSRTGEPKGLLNAGPITHYRTGAAAAIGAKYLARKDSKNLLMCGCGHVAPNLVAAALMLLPNLEAVSIVDTLDPNQTPAVLKRFTNEVDEILEECGRTRTIEIQAATNLQRAVETADVIFTATPSYQPFIQANWVKAGTHLSCIGADMSGKEEIDPSLFAHASVFGDDQEQCFSVGECEIPYQKCLLSSLHAEIGQAMTGTKPGRQSDQEITIFDSTGIALQDLASSALILEVASDKQIGQLVTL